MLILEGFFHGLVKLDHLTGAERHDYFIAIFGFIRESPADRLSVLGVNGE